LTLAMVAPNMICLLPLLIMISSSA